MAHVGVVERPHEDEEHVKWDQPDKGTWMNKTNEFGSVGGPENKRSRILGRCEQRLNVQWRSCEKSVLINCATFRRREKLSRHDGVIEGKVTHRATNLWRESFEMEQMPVYRTVHQDQLRRRSIMLTPRTEELETPSRGGKRSKGNGLAFAKGNGRTAMDGGSLPGVSGKTYLTNGVRFRRGMTAPFHLATAMSLSGRDRAFQSKDWRPTRSSPRGDCSKERCNTRRITHEARSPLMITRHFGRVAAANRTCNPR